MRELQAPRLRHVWQPKRKAAANIWQLARRVEDLFTDVAKLVQGLAAVRDELRDLEKRVPALEGRE
jgi:uncharacterized membrane protein